MPGMMADGRANPGIDSTGNYREFPAGRGPERSFPRPFFASSDKQAAACFQRPGKFFQIFRLVAEPNADPQQGFSLGDAWRSDGGNQQALVAELRRNLESHAGISHPDGNNLAGMMRHVPSLLVELLSQAGRLFQYLLTSLRLLLDPAECLQGCGSQRGWWSGGEDIAACPVCQPLDQLCRPRYKAPAAAQCLA